MFTKQLKAVLISLWAISLVFIIGVYVQHDATSAREALSWLWITVAFTVIIIGGTWLKNNVIDKRRN